MLNRQLLQKLKIIKQYKLRLDIDIAKIVTETKRTEKLAISGFHKAYLYFYHDAKINVVFLYIFLFYIHNHIRKFQNVPKRKGDDYLVYFYI